jgi:hypothetical protein
VRRALAKGRQTRHSERHIGVAKRSGAGPIQSLQGPGGTITAREGHSGGVLGPLPCPNRASGMQVTW